VGRSDSGKTTLLEGLIAELKQRGYKIAVAKHSVENFELDTVNKDTWRFTQAGSTVSAISSPDRLAVFAGTASNFEPQQLAHIAAGNCDIILAEGFKESLLPRIEVHRREQGAELLSQPEHLLAVVTDEPLAVDAPQFAVDDIAGIADLIETRIDAAKPETALDLFINGRYQPTDEPFRNLLYRTLTAMTSGIAGATPIEDLHIFLRRKS
jgi:molybdopterin-guanine dinucleotide biosynthesis protein MobB